MPIDMCFRQAHMGHWKKIPIKINVDEVGEKKIANLAGVL
jgi:hypothetical protein